MGNHDTEPPGSSGPLMVEMRALDSTREENRDEFKFTDVLSTGMFRGHSQAVRYCVEGHEVSRDEYLTAVAKMLEQDALSADRGCADATPSMVEILKQAFPAVETEPSVSVSKLRELEVEILRWESVADRSSGIALARARSLIGMAITEAESTDHG